MLIGNGKCRTHLYLSFNILNNNDIAKLEQTITQNSRKIIKVQIENKKTFTLPMIESCGFASIKHLQYLLGNSIPIIINKIVWCKAMILFNFLFV